jgi:EpsD family peptidyl-prolyl cis-trans isomerase
VKNSLGHSLVAIWRTTIVLGLCAVALLGCSKQNSQVPTGQVIARVGDEDVTSQELQSEFRADNIPVDKQKDPEVIKSVLGQLVLRKYLLKQALDAKLDREPAVLLDILRSREKVLANAYVTRKAGEKATSKEDVDTYVASHPLKFANRQLLSVEQIVFPAGPNAQTVVDACKDSKSLDEVDQKLSSMNVAHGRSMGGLNTADIPEQLFNLIQAKKADNIFFLRAGDNGVFFRVTGEEPRPLGGEAASNVAWHLIINDKINAELGIASVAANLGAKYQGEYATIMSNQSGDKK